MDFDEPNGGVQKDTLCRPLCTLFPARPELFRVCCFFPSLSCDEALRCGAFHTGSLRSNEYLLMVSLVHAYF